MTGEYLQDLPEFLAAAGEIADAIHAHALHARDGGVYWRGPVGTEKGRVSLRPLGPYLYPGTAGVALFLAACERCRRKGVDRDLCLEAIAPMRREIRNLEAVRTQPLRLLGGLSGIGSLIYVLVWIGNLLDLEELNEDALLLASLITPEAIVQDRHLDVMFGSAGALLALLALSQRTEVRDPAGRTPLQIANACARHLLDRRTACPAGKAWPNRDSGSPVGGFAHGAAGICCALLRLFQQTGDPELLAAAREGIEFERTLYVPEKRNWRLAWRTETRFVNTWCNGAPGIALGRLKGLNSCDDLSIREEIQQALELTQTSNLDADDHLCCGNMGRVEVLLVAANILRTPELHNAAHRLGLSIVQRAKAQGGFGLMPVCKGIFDPRFFLGITGIGYIFLRLAKPKLLPSVLALDTL